MITWSKGDTYPAIDSLAKAYRDKRRENTTTTLKYIGATAVLTAAVWFASLQWAVLAAGIAVVVFIVLWMSRRRYNYGKVADLIETGEFSWCAGKVQNKWKKQMFDLSADARYQIGVRDQWIECDMVTYSDTEIGKEIVLLKDGESAFGIMLPEGGAYKQVRRIARSANRKQPCA